MGYNRQIDRHLRPSRTESPLPDMNTIEKFYLSDVRCFAGESELNIRPLTFLVGENSTGKSTVLGCMQALGNFIAPKSYPNVNFNVDPYQLGTFSEIARKSNPKTSTFSLGFTLGHSSGKQSITTVRARFEEGPAKIEPVLSEISWEFPEGKINVMHSPGKKSNYAKSFRGQPGFRIRVDSKNSKYKIFDVEFFDDRSPAFYMADIDGLLSFMKYQVDIHKQDGDKSKHKAMDQLITMIERGGPAVASQHAMVREGPAERESIFIESIAPTRSKPKRTYNPIAIMGDPEGEDIPLILMKMAMTQPKEWERLRVKLIEFGKISGLFSDIDVSRLGQSGVKPFQLRVKVRGPRVNFVDVGYGISQLLPILVKMFKQKETHFLIQQPETHIHPRALAELTSLMIQNHKQHSNVFVVETHNDYMVNRARIEIMKGNIVPEDVSLIYLSPKGNIVNVHNITFDKSGNMHGEPADFQAFFMSEARALLGF